ncbi:hypothetical protein TNCV_2688891 [Trichonephila clavipes]|nr:hypothetical protein TNCV_2688891 [Trichonephila clavipes]
MRWAEQKSRTVFAICGLKDSSRNALEGNDSRTYLLLLRLPSTLANWIIHNTKIAPQTITAGVRPLCSSITHSGRQRSPAQSLTRIRPSWSHKLKRNTSEKTTWGQSACQALRS